MPAPPAILNKIKALLSLTQSSNTNESANARQLADNLIQKYGITPEELEGLKDPKPLYGDDEKLYSTVGLIGWKQQLALSVAQHFDCQIVQEKLVPSEGPAQYHYFVYGSPEEEQIVQFAFHALSDKVEELIATHCVGRGPIYISSYCEGVVDAVRQNIELEGIDLPKSKIPSRHPQEALAVSSEGLAKPKEDKPRPAEQTADVREGSFIKDILAYFKGVDDGKSLFLKAVLELAAQAELDQLTKDSDETTL